MAARSFTFGANGLDSVNGAPVYRMAGEYADVRGNDIQISADPEFKKDIKPAPALGNTPGMEF